MRTVVVWGGAGEKQYLVSGFFVVVVRVPRVAAPCIVLASVDADGRVSLEFDRLWIACSQRAFMAAEGRGGSHTGGERSGGERSGQSHCKREIRLTRGRWDRD
jgi:hypothetical protein